MEKINVTNQLKMCLHEHKHSICQSIRAQISRPSVWIMWKAYQTYILLERLLKDLYVWSVASCGSYTVVQKFGVSKVL